MARKQSRPRKDKLVTLRIEHDQWRLIQRVAKMNRTTASALLRTVASDYIAGWANSFRPVGDK